MKEMLRRNAITEWLKPRPHRFNQRPYIGLKANMGQLNTRFNCNSEDKKPKAHRVFGMRRHS
jgi:hypothetical protein